MLIPYRFKRKDPRGQGMMEKIQQLLIQHQLLLRSGGFGAATLLSCGRESMGKSSSGRGWRKEKS